MVLHITLDTNCVNARGANLELNQLEELSRSGSIELTTTFVTLNELDTDRTRFGQLRREKATRVPVARCGFMIGHSFMGGHDVIGGPDVYAHVDAIAQIISPGTPWQDLDGNTQRDVLHLSAHLTYGWDIFVTQDGGILERAPLLLERLAIRVMRPADALAEIRRSVGETYRSRA